MRTCDVDGCDRKHEGLGFCAAHYQRFKRNGDPGPAEIQGPRQPCDVEGCDRMSNAKGYCDAHYRRWRNNGDPGGPKIKVLDAKSYVGMHIKVARERGKAAEHRCHDCDAPADDWAYDHSDPNERYRREWGCPYSLDIYRYRPLCRPCHIEFDQQQEAA